MGGDLQALLAGIYQVTGATVPVVGGAAGDDRRLERTFVVHDDKVLADGAVAVWIDADRPLTVAARHGWHSTSLPMFVTSVDGFVVHEIGGRPAADVWLSHVEQHVASPDAGAHGANGTHGATGDHRPEDWHAAHALGLIEPDGTQLVRGAYIGPDGHLRTFAPLPPLGSIEMVSSRPDDLLAAAEEVAAEALSGRASAAKLLLTFSCVARLDILGARTTDEATRLHEAAGGARTVGYYTYGEFARTTGVSGFHNATLTAVAL